MEDTIYGFFLKAVKNNYEKIAIIENNRSITFGKLLELVDQIASSFPKNIKSIGIVMEHHIEMIAAILAILKCGARYVPAEVDFPIDRINYMMKEAEVDFILTAEEYQDKLKGFALQFIDNNSNATTMKTSDNSSAKQPAYVLYTSGTTGRPKGVLVTNENVCHYVRAFNHEFQVKNSDIMLQYSVCSFDIFVEEVFASLLNGAALAIPTKEDKANIYSLMRFVEKHQITIISGFPYLLAKMNHLETLPSSLRLLISGGDVLRQVYIDHLLEQVEVYNTYGPSETTVCASYYNCNQGTALKDGTYPIGKPVEGTQILILDANGNEVPTGQTGEICIFGNGVSLGYIGSHDQENQAFRLYKNDKRMYRSGDLGYLLPDGNIAFLHRKDSQIMIYGKRVEVAEVESHLYQYESVKQAIVRAFIDEKGLSYMTAYVVPTNQDIKVSAVKKELEKSLPAFMIPEFFVKMPTIPLNANGKPDLAKLPVVMKVGCY
ncbi:amino acid adenylation domain-containing protein [Thomasclavelia sp.]|uniref:amino acid adenylation domain-containing protein n=1 Tax=Thomasclavelia sp. TaxID=3025757 RepID=UPI0025D38845|nr:amino acid adenylation domain-containing protein [Thomasclavelia sp.]